MENIRRLRQIRQEKQEKQLDSLIASAATELGITVEEFYNRCNDPNTGHFCEGPDGPGRQRDNRKKTEKILPKNAPAFLHNLLSRRLNAKAQKEAAKAEEKSHLLDNSKASQTMKDMLVRKTTGEAGQNPVAVKPQPKATPKASAPAKAAASKSDPQASARAEARSSGETKKEKGGNHPESDYAYVPEGDSSSTWKLRLTSKPGAKPDRKTTAAAAQALSPSGFRGNPVQIPAKDRPAVVAKVRKAWLEARPELTEDDLPEALKVK